MFVITCMPSADDLLPNNATVSFDEGMSRIPFKSLDYTLVHRTAPVDTLY